MPSGPSGFANIDRDRGGLWLRAPVAHSFLVVTLFCGALANVARGDMIGVQFPNGSALTATQVAGVVPQDNFNTLTLGVSGFSPATLNDNNGSLTTATLTTTATPSTYPTSAGNATPDNILNSNVLNSGPGISGGNPAPAGTDVTGGQNASFTISGVPYSSYDLIVYELDNAARTEGTTVGSTTYWLGSPNATSASPYVYTQGVGATYTTPTITANYVEFTNLSGSTLTFTLTVPTAGSLGAVSYGSNANIFINGFQIVSVPEPSSIVLLGIGVGGLLAARLLRRNRGVR